MSSVTCAKCGLASETLLPSGLCSTCHSQADRPTAPPPAHDTTATDSGGAAVTPSFEYGAGGLPRCDGYLFAESDLLGQGGMGRVYRAVQASSGMAVAVKLLQADAAAPAVLRRFAVEARALAALDHPNVVRLHDFVRNAAAPFLVMELVDGQPLSKYANGKPLAPADAARLVAAAARGVHAAHRERIYHRDLKPSNLLRTADGRVKVADFGLCRRADHDDTVTLTGQLAGGTPGFMAPEQADPAAGECDAATDVWGLGATLYALLVGKPPFPTGSKNALKVLTEPYTPPRRANPAVPPELDAIAGKCLERERANRYPSAAAVADDLDNWLGGRPTVARPVGRAGRAWKRLRRMSRTVVAAWAVTAAVVGGAAALVLAGNPVRETAESIQEGYRRELRGGKPVTLIGGTGFPKHYAWRMGSPGLSESWTGDGTCAYETVGYTLLELLDDPGIDHYVVRVQLRQLNSRRFADGVAPPDEGDVGLYIGYARTPDTKGGWVTTLFQLSFSDYDPKFLGKGVVTDQQVRSAGVVYLTNGVGLPQKNGLPQPARFGHARTLFRPSVTRPGSWRTVEYEVSPTTIVPRWGAGDDPPVPLLEENLLLDARERYKETQRQVDDKLPGSGVVVPDWSPRMPLGIYCGSSAVAVRNLTVIPIPTR